MTIALRFLCGGLLSIVMSTSTLHAQDKVRVETLGSIHLGQLQEMDDQRIILSTPDGRVTLPLTEVVELSWAQPKESHAATLGRILFADGSVVPFAEWVIEGDDLHLVLTPSGHGKIRAPLSSVHSWRLPGETTPASQDQWQSICDQNVATDVLVLRRRATESIDSVEGIILSCDTRAVQFEYEGESLHVPWTRVYGLVFFRQAAELARSEFVVHGSGELRLKMTQLEVKAPLLRANNGERQVELPLTMVRRIDLSAGKTQRLSEATVIESQWKPYFQPATVGGPPQRNAAFGGGTLRLRFRDERAAGVWRVQTFDEGWALRSQSHVVLELEPWARQLRGWIGIDPATAATGSAEVTILADGEALLTLQVDGRTEPVELSLPVEGVRQLTLRVDYGENLDTGDNVHFVDLRVTR